MQQDPMTPDVGPRYDNERSQTTPLGLGVSGLLPAQRCPLIGCSGAQFSVAPSSASVALGCRSAARRCPMINCSGTHLLWYSAARGARHSPPSATLVLSPGALRQSALSVESRRSVAHGARRPGAQSLQCLAALVLWCSTLSCLLTGFVWRSATSRFSRQVSLALRYSRARPLLRYFGVRLLGAPGLHSSGPHQLSCLPCLALGRSGTQLPSAQQSAAPVLRSILHLG